MNWTAIDKVMTLIAGGRPGPASSAATSDAATAARLYDELTNRLQATEVGATLLREFRDQPSDGSRRDRLRAAVTDVLRAEPALADAAAGLTDTGRSRVDAAHSSGRVQQFDISGQVYNSNIAGRDVRITHSRRVQISAAVGAAAILALMTWGTVTFLPASLTPVLAPFLGISPTAQTHSISLQTSAAGITFRSVFDAKVAFGAVTTAVGVCNLVPADGTVNIPMTLTLVNTGPEPWDSSGGPDRYESPSVTITTSGGGRLYITQGGSCGPIVGQVRLGADNLLPRQQATFNFTIVGAPTDLSKTRVTLAFILPMDRFIFNGPTIPASAPSQPFTVSPAV